MEDVEPKKPQLLVQRGGEASLRVEDEDEDDEEEERTMVDQSKDKRRVHTMQTILSFG